MGKIGLIMKMTKQEKKILAGIKIYTESDIVTNPYSKEKVELCPD